MELTPQVLHDAEFREARKGRGYEHRDVDEFLERVAVGVADLNERLRLALERADQAEARAAAAERFAEEADGRARESTDLDDTLKRTLVLAQRTADAAIKEAQDEAATTVSTAREEGDRLIAEARQMAEDLRREAEVEARREAAGARQQALAEVQALNESRDALRADVDVLARHLDDQRRRIKNASESLERLLSDPHSLQEEAPPAIHDIEIPREDEDAGDEEDDWLDDPVDLRDSTTAEDESAPRPLRASTDAATEAYDVIADRPLRASDSAPIDPLAERDPGDEDYLAELRKAMTDDSPLGPRDEDLGDESGELFDLGRSRQRSRFGRRS
jgi:DivIVA domain-containing protein